MLDSYFEFGCPIYVFLARAMFIRQKRNMSGVVSVQVIDKSSGRYTFHKAIGSTANSLGIQQLIAEAELWVKNHSGLIEIDFAQADLLLEQLVGSIQQIKIAGIELLLGILFGDIGFTAIKDELFKKLVLARLCYPVSKLKTVDCLRRYESFATNEAAIYRYLDKFNTLQKRKRY